MFADDTPIYETGKSRAELKRKINI